MSTRIVKLLDESSAPGTPISFKAPSDGLYLLISSGGAGGTCSITLPAGKTALFEDESTTTNRTWKFKIVDLSRGDVVQLNNSQSAWPSCQRTVFYLENFDVDQNTVEEAFVQVEDSSARYSAYTNPNAYYLAIGTCYASAITGSKTNNTSGGTPIISINESVGYNQIDGIYYAKGSDMPSLDFYGYDGGGGFVYVIRGIKTGYVPHSKTVGDTKAIGDWFNSTRYSKEAVDKFFLLNNDYLAYKITFKDTTGSTITVTGQTSGNSYSFKMNSSQVARLLFFTAGETITITDGTHTMTKTLSQRELTVSLVFMPLIPQMTSNTQPSGNVIYEHVSSDAYKAFDQVDNTYLEITDENSYGMFGYEFDAPVTVKSVVLTMATLSMWGSYRDFDFDVYVYREGQWEVYGSFTLTGDEGSIPSSYNTYIVENVNEINNVTKIKAVSTTLKTSGNGWRAKTMQAMGY